MSLFVDTSIWYAAADSGDRSNAIAKRALSAGEPLVTSDHILVETWMLLNRRLEQAAADRFWEGLRAGVAMVEPVTSADFERAWSIRESFKDQKFSIVDLTSFSVMHRLGLERVASLDDDFAIYRFGPGRRRSFTVVR